jgi:hypothetical protein
MNTPVDLSSYSGYANVRASEAAAASASASMATAGAVNASSSHGAPPLQVSRRQPLDLSLSAATGTDGGAEFESPLDVPAFLRRQS